MSAKITPGKNGSFGPVSVGCPAPDFALKDGRSNEWRLSDQIGNVAVLLFYPQNETVVCTRQLCSVRDNWEDYLDTKAVIVGISAATPDDNSAFAEKRGLPIRLLADPNRTVTSIYGKHWLYPINFTRTVVVIDARGIVRNRDIMFSAFRPLDSRIITDIYAARGDAFDEKYAALRNRIATR